MSEEQEHHESFEAFIKEVVQKWGREGKKDVPAGTQSVSVVTISSEPGSGGQIIAEGISRRMGYDLFNRDIITEIANSADVGISVIESIEKERLSGVEDFIASIVNKRYLWPGVYLEHLMRVVGVIGKHGHAVIVGRGANFIIPPNERLAVRIVSPLDVRIQNIAKMFGISEEEAKKRVNMREARRKAFIRKSFNADVSDPVNYDLVINTEFLSFDTAVEIIRCALLRCSC
ncbi:AAA family ATPase [Desulfatirhabdium butyrativorans]|uniref:cytidylate kinase-like family protein n=1 Tax=Desulfatirhabdium butyrativorans TaxID=340467 RepID=UPI0003FCDC3D|nr:cytidylate kinase-like family protein [Desulfatirhabdium butyrativorans]